MELSHETAHQLSRLIHGMCGLVLGPNKGYLIRHRLEPLVRGEGLATFDEFLDRLQARGGSRLHDAIVEAITTKETSFFRNQPFFDAIARVVLPECIANLQRQAGQRHRIRIWSSACSTGQEPYSLAMIIRDLVDVDPRGHLRDGHFAILASDISSAALEAAAAGRFTENEVGRGLAPALLARHFRRSGRAWEVTESMRRLVQFRRINLLQMPASLGAFDLILCRNVLIYFDEPTRRRICDDLYALLHPGGWLAVGSAESLFGVENRLELVTAGRVLLYRKPPVRG